MQQKKSVEIARELAAIARHIDTIAEGPQLTSVLFDLLVTSSRTRSAPKEVGTGAPVSRAEIDRLVGISAAVHNVDPALIEAVIENESGFDANANSSAGARGLMQLMPATAAGLGVANRYDAGANIDGGTRYLRALLDRFGNVELAVAAYNAGPSAVERYGGVPPYAQTRDYVRSVLAAYRRNSQLGNLTTNGGSQRHDRIVP